MTEKRKTVRDIAKQKGQNKIVCLTAYTAPFAQILDNHVDILLVGDSVGMVLYGMESTLGVTLDMMINHGKAVVSHSKKSLVVVDMPFGSYQKNKEQAFENCARVLAETGCGAVKIEGGVEMAETIEYLTKRGIAVMAHIGLLPQSVNSQGGYRTHGKTDEEYKSIIADAKAVEKAGAFSVVLEGVVADLAHEITDLLKIPTIGIGASGACDGQVLVTEDMIGLSEITPKFVKKFGNARENIEQAVKDFSTDVRSGKFPEKANFTNKKLA